MPDLLGDLNSLQQVDNIDSKLDDGSQRELNKLNTNINLNVSTVENIDKNKVDSNCKLNGLEITGNNQQHNKFKCKLQTHHHHHRHHHHISNKVKQCQAVHNKELKSENLVKKSIENIQQESNILINTIDSTLIKLTNGNEMNSIHNIERDLSNINLGYQNRSLISVYDASNQLSRGGNTGGVTHTLTLSKSTGNNLNHCHTTDFVERIDKKARKKLIIASFLCLLFMIGETVGGLLSNSLAIATDAAHLLADFASFMISLFSIWLASRPASKKMSFGYYRAEVIGALTSVLLIWVVTGILVMMAIQRLTTNDFDLDVSIMLITAAIGVVMNIIMGLSLQIGGVPHGHHGHSHHNHHNYGELHNSDDSHSSSSSYQNLNVRAALIHVIGDFIQSLGVMLAAIVIYFYPNLRFIDPVCTFFFSILVLFTTFHIIRDVINVLMEGMPKGIDFFEVQKTLFNIPGVIKVHNLRVWSLSLDKIALSAHLAIGKNQDPKHILLKASKLIKDKFKIFDLTIQVEEYKDEMKDCNQCNPPNFYSDSTKLLKK